MKDGALSLNIHSQYGIPLVISADGATVSFDKSYDCQQGNNNIQKFFVEYSTEEFIQKLTLSGKTAMRGEWNMDAEGNSFQKVTVM